MLLVYYWMALAPIRGLCTLSASGLYLLLRTLCQCTLGQSFSTKKIVSCFDPADENVRSSDVHQRFCINMDQCSAMCTTKVDTYSFLFFFFFFFWLDEAWRKALDFFEICFLPSKLDLKILIWFFFLKKTKYRIWVSFSEESTIWRKKIPQSFF